LTAAARPTTPAHWRSERSRNHIQALLRLLALHSGLIQERDQGYSFIHFTLQEYLTARDYDERDDTHGLARMWPEARWRETILLAVGHWATSGYPQRAQELLGELLETGAIEALVLVVEALDEANARLASEANQVVITTSWDFVSPVCSRDLSAVSTALSQQLGRRSLDRRGAVVIIMERRECEYVQLDFFWFATWRCRRAAAAFVLDVSCRIGNETLPHLHFVRPHPNTLQIQPLILISARFSPC
jgi:hypothetical protein